MDIPTLINEEAKPPLSKKRGKQVGQTIGGFMGAGAAELLKSEIPTLFAFALETARQLKLDIPTPEIGSELDMVAKLGGVLWIALGFVWGYRGIGKFMDRTASEQLTADRLQKLTRNSTEKS